MIVELSDEECKMLWDIINYTQSRVIEKQANISFAYSKNESFAEVINIWNKETIDEWMILHNIKKRLKWYLGKGD